MYCARVLLEKINDISKKTPVTFLSIPERIDFFRLQFRLPKKLN
ncbi:hypothetical protein LEP1GSC062_4482 [Leptospira alexanderi serovar Manhao 3 str. L 60]|uniref:Uncharacterized protein n=1 Tax=Leptospira alexanderi serovar Manhao 3 str. L 60 TaxID=1049759 RepID=V6IFY4_9LEPT|nr:hypothetical protein LEP1GSC062_4482 [Leptospira alexanderi serovar Manhao 3 str. L 60]